VTEPSPHADVSDPDVTRAASAPDGSVGHPAVDDVLASLETVEGRPVHEHAAVFESAHERLRAALDAATGTPAS
jgi:hypothetical protein